MLYDFKLGYNTTEATKDIYCAKGKDAVDHNYQMVQEILLRMQDPWQLSKVRLAFVF